MYETNEVENKVNDLFEKLTHLIELNMAIMVQLTKIYDVTVFNAVREAGVDSDDLGDLVKVLNGHEGGFMATSEPVLRAFAAPTPNNPPEETESA